MSLDDYRRKLNWWASAAPRRRGYPERERQQMVRLLAVCLPASITATRKGLRMVLVPGSRSETGIRHQPEETGQ